MPLRKAIHLAVGLVPLAGWLLSPRLAVAALWLLLAASIAVEAGRRWCPSVNQFLWRLLPSVFRADERSEVLGSTWFAAGALSAVLLFGLDAGGTGILFLALGDPAAESVGRRWGRSGQRKTLVGSAACLAACLLASTAVLALGRLTPGPALLGAAVAVAVERWSPPPDDNLWMPMLSALAIAALRWLVGA